MAKTKKTALEYAAGLLGTRAYSTAELRKKMFEKEYPAAEIRSILEDFTKRGFLNDRLYAESLCNALSARGNGARKIREKLRLKGIAPELIKEILESVSTEMPEEESALEALHRKRSTLLREPDVRKRKEKAFRFLAGRGFSAGSAYAAWEQFIKEE